MEEKIIPITQIRYFYNTINEMFSTDTHMSILSDLNRGKDYKKLTDIYNKSKDYFKQYSNDESFIGNKKHRKQPMSTEDKEFKKTNDVISFFIEAGEEVKVHNDSILTFKYIEREIDPRRMTGAKYSNGISGKSSGIGRIDFIAWNKYKRMPIIGEIKCCSDSTPFLAFIQLLVYCTEMTTPAQIKRINDTKLFGDIRGIELPFLLYIFLADFNLRGKKKELIGPLKELSLKIVEDISDIEDIVILNANKENKIVSRL